MHWNLEDWIYIQIEELHIYNEISWKLSRKILPDINCRNCSYGKACSNHKSAIVLHNFKKVGTILFIFFILIQVDIANLNKKWIFVYFW